MPIRAVLFDIGGVIADSPIMAIRRYCESIGIPDINPFLGDSPA
jgi:beta-phosphoglucomutase-like phosphatase (HAD superfamily)